MELLSVTMNGGVMQRSEIEGKDNSSEDKSNYKVVRKGDMVYNSMRMWQGANGVSSYDGIVSPAYTVLTAKVPICNDYFAALFKNYKLINKFRKNSQGMTSDTWNLKYPQIETIKVYLPEVAEQEKVASMLVTLDKRIAAQATLVEQLKKYKRGLLCQLISGKCSSLQKHNWNIVKLGDVFMERNERATGGEELLAVTINAGVQRRSEIDLKDNSSDDKSNYKRVMRGDIAYNTMRMWQGASGASNYDGIVSPAYTVITPIHPHQINIRFWAQYFKYEPLVKTFQKFSQGLTSDTWNLKFPQFAEIKVYYPPYDIQNEVANVLMSFDERIRSEEETLRQLNRLRLSLYAQLFI